MRDDIEPIINPMSADTPVTTTYTPTKISLKVIAFNVILIPINLVSKIYNKIKSSFNEQAYYKPYAASIDSAQLKITAFIALVKKVDPVLAKKIIESINHKYPNRVKLNFDLVDSIGLPDTNNSNVNSLLQKKIQLVNKVRIMQKIAKLLKEKHFINLDEYIKILKIIELQGKLQKLEDHLLGICAKTSNTKVPNQIDSHAKQDLYTPGPSTAIIFDANPNKVDLITLEQEQKTNSEFISRLELDADVMLLLKDPVQIKIFKVLQREALRQTKHSDIDYKTALGNLFARVFVAKHDTTSNLAKFAHHLSGVESNVTAIFSPNQAFRRMDIGRSQIRSFTCNALDDSFSKLSSSLPATYAAANHKPSNHIKTGP